MIDTIATTVLPLLGLGVVLFFVFLMTPAANVLNVVTVPLGYEFTSCPYCPEFGVKKIEYYDCDNCGEEHGRAYSGAASYVDGEKYRYCSNECLDEHDPNGGGA